MRSSLTTIFLCALLLMACAPALASPISVLPPSTNLPALIISTETALPPTESIAPSSLPTPVPQTQPYVEFTSGTLWIRLFTPQDGAVVQTPTITVIGQSPADTVISLNDIIYIVPADQFINIPVNLEEGPNVLEIVASDVSGNELTYILTVTYEP